MSTDGRTFQEFYCRTSGGGCGGYVLLPIASAGTYKVTFECPKCHHRHDRGVVEGQIVDRLDKRIDQQKCRTIELLSTLSAWSAEPRTRAMMVQHVKRQRAKKRNRSGPEPEASVKAGGERQFLADAWVNAVGEKTT